MLIVPIFKLSVSQILLHFFVKVKTSLFIELGQIFQTGSLPSADKYLHEINNRDTRGTSWIVF